MQENTNPEIPKDKDAGVNQEKCNEAFHATKVLGKEVNLVKELVIYQILPVENPVCRLSKILLSTPLNPDEKK